MFLSETLNISILEENYFNASVKIPPNKRTQEYKEQIRKLKDRIILQY